MGKWGKKREVFGCPKPIYIVNKVESAYVLINPGVWGTT
jgi:hypothetical protein